MVKHIALETTARDIHDFYVEILGGKITRKFTLRENEALKIFRMPEQIEVVEIQLQKLKLVLFIYEVFEQDSLQHICLQLNRAAEIFGKARQNNYWTHLRKKDKSEAYFIKDNNGNMFEIRNKVLHYEKLAE